MNNYDVIETKSLLLTLYIRIFSNKFVITAFEIIMTTIISIHTSKTDLESKKWTTTLIIYVAIFLLVNLLSVIAECLENKKNKQHKYLHDSYLLQDGVNCKTANNLYRVNKKINTAIRENCIAKGELNSVADFQNLSFYICNELYSFVKRICKCDECEITIYQRFVGIDNKDYVKMIAYRNGKNLIPSSYNEEYKLSHKSNTKVPVFVSIFNDLNADTKILCTRKQVKEEFLFFENSRSREEQICQYIGIPIKTNRNKIEVVLQIDVSKEKVFGSSYNDVKQFADIILSPFANLLHCSYERDIILNKFYDILEENINRSQK